MVCPRSALYVTPRKTANSSGKSLIIEWSDELRLAIDEIKTARKKINSIWLFHTNIGQPYIKEDGTANGFDSIWRRFINKVLAETKLKERFTEHDLRSKVASDTNIEHASILLGHASKEITQRVYRRKAETVKPIDYTFRKKIEYKESK